VLAPAQDIDADPPALQIADGANRFVREQLEAAGMQPRERHDRQSRIQADDDGWRIVDAEIELAVRVHLRRCGA
jgi:hypothetical protein